MRSYRVVVIPGDGIGPEIVESALRVLSTVQGTPRSFEVQLDYHKGGARCFQETGHALPPQTLEACRQADAVMKGPAGLPEVRNPDGTEAGLLGGVLRNGLDTYANVRPVRLWPSVDAPTRFKPGQVDYVIVRENTEGLYASRGLGVSNRWAASDILFMTRPGVERVSRFAFELARKRKGSPRDGVRRVTCVDKSNVLKSFWFFRQVFDEVGADYPDVQKDYLYSDAAAQALVMDPSRFDVLVMENFLGDLLSDLGGGTTGGIGLCPSGNYGDKYSYFEPVHGSAPTLAGQGRANPVAQVLSLALMLQHLNEADAAERVNRAVWQAFASGALAIGGDGCPAGGTRAATDAILKNIGAA